MATPPQGPAPTAQGATDAENAYKYHYKGEKWYLGATNNEKSAANSFKSSKYGKSFREKIQRRRNKKNEKEIKNKKFADKFLDLVEKFPIENKQSLQQSLQQSVIMSGIRNITSSIDEILASSVSSEIAKVTISSGIDILERKIQKLSPLIKTTTELQALETKIQQLKENIGSIKNMERNITTKTQKKGSRYAGYVIAAGGAGMTITGGVMIKQQLGQILLGTGLAGFLIGVGLVMYSVDRKRAGNQVMAGLESSKGAIENTYLTLGRGVGGIMGRTKFSKLISFLEKYKKLESGSMILTNRNKLYILKEIKKHTDKIIEELEKKKQLGNPEIEWFKYVTPIITNIYRVVYQEYTTGRVTKESNFMKKTKKDFAEKFVRYLIENQETLLYLQSDINLLTQIRISLYERGNPLATAQQQATGQTPTQQQAPAQQQAGYFQKTAGFIPPGGNAPFTWRGGVGESPQAPGINQMQLTPQQGQYGREIMVTRSQDFDQGKSPDDYFVIQTQYGQVTVYPPAGVNWNTWKHKLKKKFQFLQRQHDSGDDSSDDSDEEASEMHAHAREEKITSPTSPATPKTPQRSTVNFKTRRRQQAYLPLLKGQKINKIVTQLNRMKNTKRQSNLKFIEKQTTPEIFAQISAKLKSSRTSAATTNQQSQTAPQSSRTSAAAASNQQSQPGETSTMNYYKGNKKLEELQTKTRKKQYSAATKIQSVFRGRQARKQARTKKLETAVGAAQAAVKWRKKAVSKPSKQP